MMQYVLGASIGSYVVSAKLATGGMGTVYVAKHTALDKRVAIKILLPEMSHDRTVVTRFFNEAKAASAIRHPSIVEIYDVGYTPEGHAYLVMEMLDGESLASRRKRLGRLEPRRAMLFARQIAGGLAATHEHDIVHRDLKPDNVFIVRDPEVPGGERIKLLDFGVAKLHKNLDETALTQVGSILGTPTYMAPEQCRGAGSVDARADLYALGCVLYEMLLGRPPFTHDGAGGVMAHHLYFEAEKPRELDPSLPESIEEIVLWLLRKDPAQRPQTARELIAAIDRTGFGSLLPAEPEAPASSQRASSEPAVLATPMPTTLTAASGTRTPTLVPVTPPRRWIVPVVAGIGVVAGIAIFLNVRTGAPPSSPSVERTTSEPHRMPEPAPAAPAPALASAPPPAPRPVRLAIESDPAGASLRVDGKPVGTTPYVDTFERHAGSRTYTVQKAGYDSATATLSTASDGSAKIVLKKKMAKHHRSSTENPNLGDRGVNPFD